MSTGTKIVQAALQKIGAHTVMKPANPESLANGKDKLNSFIAMLQDDDIDSGAVPLNAIGDELSEPLGITNAIEDNLAIALQPDHPGSQISPRLYANAIIGMAMIRRKYKAIVIPQQVARETFPKGAGNEIKESDGYYNDTFFFKGEKIG